MKKVIDTEILKIAEKLVKKERKWHFHTLTPGCVFNKDKRFALVMENSSDKKQFVSFSLKKPAKTGQILVEMLHGKGISKKNPSARSGLKSSRKVTQMVERAIELNNKGFTWHHHLLFPDCIFNKDSRYWTLVFEDPLNGEVIEEMSKDKPIAALQQIEPLFYAQKK